MAKVLDWRLKVSKSELQSCYYIHFWTYTLGESINLLIPPAMGYIIPLLFFSKDGFDIK